MDTVEFLEASEDHLRETLEAAKALIKTGKDPQVRGGGRGGRERREGERGREGGRGGGLKCVCERERGKGGNVRQWRRKERREK